MMESVYPRDDAVSKTDVLQQAEIYDDRDPVPHGLAPRKVLHPSLVVRPADEAQRPEVLLQPAVGLDAGQHLEVQH